MISPSESESFWVRGLVDLFSFESAVVKDILECQSSGSVHQRFGKFRLMMPESDAHMFHSFLQTGGGKC